MSPRTGVQRVVKLRDQLLAEVAKHHAQIDILKIQIETYDRAIAELERAEPSAPSANGGASAVSAPRGKKTTRKRRAARGNVKTMLEEFLKEVAGKGLNAAIAVQMAELRGHSLDRNSVSSLLSRWKTDGAVFYDGDKYRLKEFATPLALVAPAPAAQPIAPKAA